MEVRLASFPGLYHRHSPAEERIDEPLEPLWDGAVDEIGSDKPGWSETAVIPSSAHLLAASRAKSKLASFELAYDCHESYRFFSKLKSSKSIVQRDLARRHGMRMIQIRLYRLGGCPL